jgi:signal transduction histidine kinase
LAGDVVVTAATPIYADREYLGMLVAELNLSKLQDVIDQVSIEEGFSFIVDSKGTYIAHPNDTLVRERQYFSNLSFLERARQSPITFEILRGQPGDPIQIASISQVKQDWFVVTMQPINSVLFPLSALAAITLLAFTVTMLLFFMRVQRSLQDIAVPVSMLAEKAEQISQGDYEVEFEHSKRQFQEINSLEKSFTRMLTGIQNRDRYLEQRVEERTRQLEEANQDLEAFLYSVSHDLRAPLRAVIGYSDILAAEYDGSLDEEGEMYLERILAQGRRMDQLITDLLDLSRLGRKSLKVEDVDLSELAQKVFEREVDKYEHGSVTELVLHPTPSVPADPQMAEIMLTNLIDNAIKFSAQTAHPKIEFGYLEDEEQSYFYLRDNGIGFDPKYAEKLFIPFQRLQDVEEYEGSGIGLAIVQRVVRSHGGKIWMDSVKRKGTTFYFYL